MIKKKYQMEWITNDMLSDANIAKCLQKITDQVGFISYLLEY